MEQISFGAETKQQGFKGFDLWKLLCVYSGREFPPECCTPVALLVYTDDDVVLEIKAEE